VDRESFGIRGNSVDGIHSRDATIGFDFLDTSDGSEAVSARPEGTGSRSYRFG